MTSLVWIGLGVTVIAFVAGTNGVEVAGAKTSSRGSAFQCEITVTNLTRGQVLSPPVVTAHTSNLTPLFVEGHVHVHAGILEAATCSPLCTDWRTPVAKISITRVPNASSTD